MRPDNSVIAENSIAETAHFRYQIIPLSLIHLALGVAILLIAGRVAYADFPEIRFSAQSIEQQQVSMRDVRAQLFVDGRFTLVAASTRIADAAIDIPDISLEGSITEASFSPEGAVLSSRFHAPVFTAELSYTQAADKVTVVLTLDDQDLLTFSTFPGLPDQADWLKAGRAAVELRYTSDKNEPGDLRVRLDLRDLGFDSPDGRFAADSLAMTVELAAPVTVWPNPGIKGAISGGELLADDFYRDFTDAELNFAIEGTWNEDGLDIQSFNLTDRDSLTVAGRAAVDFAGLPDSWSLQVNRLELKFPLAYERYVESAAAAWTLDGLGISGQLSWNGQWDGGQFRSGDLNLTDLSIVDTRRNRFAFTGLEARVRPGDDLFHSKLAWRGLLLGKINLGPGEAALDSAPGKFAIVQPVVLEVLEGRLVLWKLAVLLGDETGSPANEPEIHLEADIEDLDMEQLTRAFGWPLFSGKISGHIPGVSLNDGVLEVEGKILVNVFDGQLSLTDLRVERPFGVLPSLAANIEAEGLDLEQLTRTFSFGQISGRVDGYIRDLRMLDWKPVAFDAWFGTPPGQKGSRDISRKAVNRLTTLGGGGPTTALTSPLLKLFNNFSYKSLGLGCRMQNNVCDIRGVKEDNESVLIMEGAGVPKITIRAFNRRVDWPQLMSQLVAASETDSIKVGD